MKTEDQIKEELTARLALQYLKGKISRDQLVTAIGYLVPSVRGAR